MGFLLARERIRGGLDRHPVLSDVPTEATGMDRTEPNHKLIRRDLICHAYADRWQLFTTSTLNPANFAASMSASDRFLVCAEDRWPRNSGPALQAHRGRLVAD